MKLIVLAFTLVSIGSTQASASGRVSESCTGTETVRVGGQTPETLPYSLNFSADLSAKSYCYDKCGRAQTYPISDVTSNPLKLADFNGGGQTRRLIFDRERSALTDYQIIAAGPIRVVRNATATCKAAKFHEPWTDPKSDVR